MKITEALDAVRDTLHPAVVALRWLTAVAVDLFFLRYIVPISLLLWFHVFDPLIDGRIVRRRVYYDLPDGEVEYMSFNSNDFWFLCRQGWVGSSSDGRWYFMMGCTPESAREALAEVAADRAERRREAYERRPRWSWERAECPTFKDLHNFADKTFKLFQWLAVAVVVRYVAVSTEDDILFLLGHTLVFIAVAPYIILLFEFVNTRLNVTPESSGKWVAIYLLAITACLMVVTVIASDVVERLVEALYKTQPR